MNITKMAKKKNMNNRRILNFVSVLSLFLMFSFAFMPSVIAQDDFVITPVGSEDNNCQIGEVYLQDRGCIKPQFNADFNVFPTPEGKISSSLGDIQAIRINNPYAAGGQPVVVEFTLQNIGDQLGYPFDKIDLPADVYALQLAVDKDIQVVMADGRRVDVWGMMTGYQKVIFLLGLSNGQFWEQVKKSLEGRTCGYVEMSKYLPQNVRERLQDMNNGKEANVYSWQCIKIVDMPYFRTAIKSYCGSEVDSGCISRLNTELGNSVSDVVTVLLSSGEKSGLTKGQCERPNSGTFWKNLGGYLAGNVNVVECAIGSSGLKPGDRVTFSFVALVPSDAPSVSPQALSQLTEIKNLDGDLYGGYTESASCIDSSNPKACHTVYGAVYPVAQENLVSWFGNRVNQVTSLIKCSGNEIWHLGRSSFKGCMATGHSNIDVVGEPVWEGQGIFFVLAPALSARITMILWGVYVAGALTPYLRRP